MVKQFIKRSNINDVIISLIYIFKDYILIVNSYSYYLHS